MEECGGLTVGGAAAPKGWVIGPLFQSFRSKMASFTEIVMSPVKLFRANSPPPLSADHPDALELQDDAEPSSDMFVSAGDGESWDQEAETHRQRISDGEGARNSQPGALKKLSFDAETDECGITQREMNSLVSSVPLPDPLLCRVAATHVSEPRGSGFIPPALPEPFVSLSASRESALEVEEEHKEAAVRLEPLPRKWTRNRSQEKKAASTTLLSEARKDEVGVRQLSQTLPPICYSDSPQPDDDDDDEGKKIESSLVRQSLRNNSNFSANNAQTLEQLERLNLDSYPAAGSGRSKRGLKPSCRTQEPVKRKKLAAQVSTEDAAEQQGSLNTTSKSAKARGLKPPKKEVASAANVVDVDETLKPPRKRQTASTKANKKGKGGGEMEAALNPQTESSPDALLICSLDQTVSVSVGKNGSGRTTKRSGSGKRVKTKPSLGESDLNIDSMDLETTVAITSTAAAQQQQEVETAVALAEVQVLVRPEIKQLQTTIKSRSVNKKPVKRKSPGAKTDSIAAQPLDLTDLNAPPVVEEEAGSKLAPNQPPKRNRKGCRGAAQETKQSVNNLHVTTKESQTDPVYFEMTPFENNHHAAPSLPQCSVQLDKQEVESTAPVTDMASPNSSFVTVRPRAGARRRDTAKPRRADPQRRRCTVLYRVTRKGEEKKSSITMEDADLTAVGFRSDRNGIPRRLLRSYSCPEIPSLCSQDAIWTPPHHSRTHTSHKASHAAAAAAAHVIPPTHKSLRRARRHTVCSVEVEREIAPLCLRKEVYPASRRSALYDGVAPHLSPGLALSPSSSLSVLASCFLSSPLAFLSKKVEGRGATASPSASAHAPSFSSSSSVTSPLSSNTWHLPAFLQRGDSSRAASDSCSR